MARLNGLPPRDSVSAALALIVALGSAVTAAATAIYFGLKMFPDTLPRPPRFCLVDQVMLLGYNGASATVIPLMVLVTLPLWRPHVQGRMAPLVHNGLRSTAALLLLGLVCEVLQLMFMPGFAYRPLQAVGQVCDVLAVATVTGAVLTTVSWQTLLLDPRWSWRLALFLAVFPGMLASIGKPGYSEQVFLWLRVGAFPAAFVLFWDASLREREPSSDSGLLNLVGIIFFVAAAIFLHVALLLTTSRSGVIPGANIVILAVVSGVCLVLLGLGVVQLWRHREDRLEQLGHCLGLLILFFATLPKYQPPWIKHSFGLIMRLTLGPSQAMVGLGLMASLRVLSWLRRRDPRGPPSFLRVTWMALSCAYLISDVVSDWIWTHEIWVRQAQMVSDVLFRLRVTNGFVLLGAASLLALIPSVRRVVTAPLATPASASPPGPEQQIPDP